MIDDMNSMSLFFSRTQNTSCMAVPMRAGSAFDDTWIREEKSFSIETLTSSKGGMELG